MYFTHIREATKTFYVLFHTKKEEKEENFQHCHAHRSCEKKIELKCVKKGKNNTKYEENVELCNEEFIWGLK